MAFLHPTRSNRVLPHVLAAAIVHLLGACPCGCLDGNLWLQQIGAVAEMKDGGDTGEPPVGIDHACDDDSLTWLAGDVNETDLRVAAAMAAATPGETMAVVGAPVGSTAILRTPAAPTGVSARRLRATLQVFLI